MVRLVFESHLHTCCVDTFCPIPHFSTVSKLVRFLELGLIIDVERFPAFRTAFEPAFINWDIDPDIFKQTGEETKQGELFSVLITSMITIKYRFVGARHVQAGRCDHTPTYKHRNITARHRVKAGNYLPVLFVKSGNWSVKVHPVEFHFVRGNLLRLDVSIFVRCYCIILVRVHSPGRNGYEDIQTTWYGTREKR